MKSLKEILFRGPKAEAAGTLIDGHSPGTIAEDECVGHIVMTRHKDLPCGFAHRSSVSFWV